MRKELDELLCQRYPEIFADRHADPTISGMGWGFCCGDYWFDLIDSLCAEIAAQVTTGVSQPVVARQVKEKFRRLRFHFRGGNGETWRLTQDAADQSEDICDACGLSTNKSQDLQSITCPNCDGGVRNHCPDFV